MHSYTSIYKQKPKAQASVKDLSLYLTQDAEGSEIPSYSCNIYFFTSGSIYSKQLFYHRLVAIRRKYYLEKTSEDRKNKSQLTLLRLKKITTISFRNYRGMLVLQ